MIHSKPIRIKVDGLNFSRAGSAKKALDAISFTVYENEYVCIMGANGSGKSTLLSCINGMETPPVGTCFVFDISANDISAANISTPDTSNSNTSSADTSTADTSSADTSASNTSACDCGTEGGLARARRICGTVMQNPEDQIIGSIVADDVAFSPENEGLDEAETARRVQWALEAAGLTGLRDRNVETLSGGQKQRLALAGLLASGAEILLLDEPDSMLDPAAKSSLDVLILALWRSGKTILRVTHNACDARAAPRCLVLEGGRLIYDGPPAAYLEKIPLENYGGGSPPRSSPAVFRYPPCGGAAPATPPPPTKPAAPPAGGGLHSVPPADGPEGVLKAYPRPPATPPTVSAGTPDDALVFLNVSYTYKSAAGSLAALNGLSFSLPRGRSLALMGHTGSGKSTALKLANALILPDSGAVHILGDDTQNPKVDLRALRFRAALAVQNPENALFETYVCDDVAFGPRNKGLRGEALVNAVRQAMEAAGLPFDEYAARPTYALSGGEKRLAALAGLLAMDADLYLLDEPAAGLDGANTRRVLALLDVLKARGKTIVAATHSVELAQKQDFLLTMNAGSCQLPVAGCQLSKGVRQAKRRTGVEFFNTDDAGGYLGIPSVLSRMGAAAKIVVFSLAAVAVFVGKTHFLAAGGIVFTLFCAVFAGRIRMGYMLRGLLPLLPFLLILTAVQFVFNFQADASPVIFRLGAAVLTTTELFTTVRTSLRFAAIISVLRLYSAVTSPKDSLAAIKKLLQPLAKIGLPLNDIVLAATVTTRFIPILRAEARAIVEAQAARGARFSGFGRLRCLFSLILPLFIRALERAQTLAAAITMRGYR